MAWKEWVSLEAHRQKIVSDERGQSPRLQGMTLVELLVAVTVTSVVLVFIYGGFSAHRRLYGQEQQILELQQNLRLALDMVVQVVHQAGYWRCVEARAVRIGAQGVKSTLKSSEGLFHTQAVMGFNNVTATTDPFVDKQTREGTDILGYSLIDPAFDGPLAHDQVLPRDPLRLVKNKATGSLKKGQIVFLTDCRQSALFQITNVFTDGDTLLQHDPDVLSPGNTTRCLRCDDGGTTCVGDVECSAAGTGFRRGISWLHPVKVGFFRVSKSGDFQWIEGGPDTTGNYVFSTPRTLAENVEDFQVEWGVDSSPVPDGLVDAWVSADAIPETFSGSGLRDWERVHAVRCHILGRTRRPFKGYTDTTVYAFADRKASGAASDAYRRLHMMKTIGIRNAMP
ncbi:MAG: PilW family protein [Desulfosoma sp.]